MCDRFRFVGLPTHGVGEFVGNGHHQEFVEPRAVFRKQGPGPVWISPEQRLLQKRLALLQDCERRTIGVAAHAAEYRLPVLGSHENPAPFAKCREIQTGQYRSQLAHLTIAGRLCVPRVAIERLFRLVVRIRLNGAGYYDTDCDDLSQLA
jgi:hypothetical protein